MEISASSHGGKEVEVCLMSDEKLNLKGKKDCLVYYVEVDSGEVEKRERLVDIYNETAKKVYYYPVKNRILFEEDEIRKFSLDKYGEHIPYIDGQLTILNNYFFDFWGYYLNAEGTALYAHLKRYAYGEKDYCYPNFELIEAKMGKARSTLHRYLDLLQRYGFVYRFGVLNKDKLMAEEPPIFKIRRQIPLLSKKLIYGDPTIEIPEDAPSHIKKALMKEQKGLPPILQKEHEKFVKKHMENKGITIRIEDGVDYEAIYQAWKQFGKLLEKNNPNQSKRKTAKAKHIMSESEKLILSVIHKYVENKVSKPSFDTWFKDIFVKFEKTILTIFAPNDFAKDWLENQYHGLIKESLSQVDTIEINELRYETQ